MTTGDDQPIESVHVDASHAKAVVVGDNAQQTNVFISMERDPDRKVDLARAEIQRWGRTIANERRWDWHALGHALKLAHEAVEFNPTYQRPWTLLADIYHRIGQLQLARSCLARSRDLAAAGRNGAGRFYGEVERNLDTGYPFNSSGGLDRQEPPDWFMTKYRRYLKPDLAPFPASAQ